MFPHHHQSAPFTNAPAAPPPQVYLITLDVSSTNKATRPKTFATFELDVGELVNRDHDNEERLTLTFDPMNSEYEKKYNHVNSIAQGGVSITMEVILRSSSKGEEGGPRGRVSG